LRPIIIAVLSSPIEHVRIRLQTQPHGANALYNGPLDCIKKLIAAGGGVGNGLYRGTGVTLLREAQAYGVWFLTFEYLMKRTMVHTKREDIPSWKIALYGGLAGEALWLASYPFDVVKSKLQTDGFKPGHDKFYKSAVDCTKQVWAKEGMMGFWRGLTPTLMRALPVSAGTFFVYAPPLALLLLHSALKNVTDNHAASKRP
jgi:solute carrier family 25 carnitine/acylcarnitine transporter 20/29